MAKLATEIRFEAPKAFVEGRLRFARKCLKGFNAFILDLTSSR